MFLVFHDVTGILIGMFCAVALQACLYVILLWRTDWEKQCKLAQERTGVKFSMDETSDNLLNGDIHKKESELVLSSWIHKSSSLPFLSAFDAEVTQFRPSLPLRDFNGHHEFKSQGSEPNTAVCDVKHNNRLTFSEKKSLIRKRLIPLIISLLILGAAVAVHLLVPVPSSHENGSVGNDMFINGFNMTSNTTQNR